MDPAQQTLQLLNGAESRLSAQRALVGLDGFVDQIIRVVDKRQKDGTATYICKIPEWGARIQAAGGKSAKFELSVKQVKLGGNGPIMANALARFGLKLTCIGNLGFPDLHPVFRPMKQICDMLTVADASYTDALEFEDGKIMLSRQESAADVRWETLKRVIGEEPIFRLFEESHLVALNNWTALPHMSEIWRNLQQEICPRLSVKADSPRRNLFLDLADPEFREAADIREALQLIGRFSQWFDTTLGLNEKEAAEIADALQIAVPGESDRGKVRGSAESIRSKLGIEGVVVHARAFAAAASPGQSSLIEGPFAEKPLISTGAGDHFNAGYSLGILLGGTLEHRLQLGAATSGFYVRTAQSPGLKDLREFLNQIASKTR